MATNNSINNLNFNNVTSVTTTAVLTTSAYGTEVICTGSSAYTVTLPTVTGNANKFIDIYSQTTSHALVTISPASGTIAGQANIIIGSGDGVRIMNDGTNWWVLNTWLQPANFQATLSAPQTIPSGPVTKIDFDGVLYDIGGFFDSVTNHRYIPLLPGKYVFNLQLYFAATGVTSTVQSGMIEKNGSTISNSRGIVAVASAINTISPVSIMTYMNGTTDYIEGFCSQNSGGNLDTGPTDNSSILLAGSRYSLF